MVLPIYSYHYSTIDVAIFEPSLPLWSYFAQLIKRKGFSVLFFHYSNKVDFSFYPRSFLSHFKTVWQNISELIIQRMKDWHNYFKIAPLDQRYYSTQKTYLNLLFIFTGWCNIYYNSRRENISFPSSRFWREGALDSCSWRNCFKVGFSMFKKERRFSDCFSRKSGNFYMKTHGFAVIKSV